MAVKANVNMLPKGLLSGSDEDCDLKCAPIPVSIYSC